MGKHEWRESANHLVQNSTCGPDVDFTRVREDLARIVLVLKYKFWSQIYGCANYISLYDLRFLACAKIDEFYPTVVCYHNVVWLEVPMHNAFGLEFYQNIHYLVENVFYHKLIFHLVFTGPESRI